MIEELLKLDGEAILSNFIDGLKDSDKVEAIKKEIDTELGLTFKKTILNEIYWEYYFWGKEPDKIISVVYSRWKNILKTCMFCSESVNIRKCPMIDSEFAYVCKDHCDTSRKWTMRVKGKPMEFSAKYCMMRREPVTCKEPVWKKLQENKDERS